MQSIYLAGFDVFRPDARAWGETLKMLCAKYGFDGHFPLDNRAPKSLQGAEMARWIYEANIDLLRRCDGVVGNVNPFRGAEPDSGTVFELGYAVAMGKPVWVYTDEKRSLVEQVAVDRQFPGGPYTDTLGYTVEDFGHSLNLMIACSCTVVHGDLEDCLAQMAG